MMRKVFSVALVAALFGLVQTANAGVTIDLQFQDATVPSGITITEGDAGTGCAFGGYYHRSVATGYCMDVILRVGVEPLIGAGISVTYDSDNGLALASMNEWIGLAVGSGMMTGTCAPFGGLVDNGGVLQSFDCGVPPPPDTSGVVALQTGTYKIGTIIWDTSATTFGQETIAAYLDTLVDGFVAIVGGAPVDLVPTLNSHILNIVPEPGTASLLGLGLVGLILAGRRSRA